MATELGFHPCPDDLEAALATNVDRCFECLVLTYQDRLYSFALRLTHNAQDAEEIAQDAFVRAYRALAGYEPERIATLALRPWLYQIALNVFRNRVRSRQLPVLPLDELGHDPEFVLVDQHERPDAALERVEREHELSALVGSLPERYRLAVVLRHVEGFGYGELAEMLCQPVGTIKANVHRGTKLLRAALEQQMQEVD
ncbi:MAG TPA: sigma-70 family RNA polymerase sigma factor [Herpetosiphonaceae bacterium]